MNILVAGAGAGKTSSLSEKIIKAANLTDKMIFCISFTNESADIINEKLNQHYSSMIPTNIKVSTIHHFLYQEIIKPYNYFINGNDYEEIVNININKPEYKAARLKQLREHNLLDIKDIYPQAKNIVCFLSKDRKDVKKLKNTIVSTISDYTSNIFVDEAQDINEDIAKILKRFYEAGINISLIGDPKQDIQGNKLFSKIISDEGNGTIKYKNENHRCPTSHLNISNIFIHIEQQQFSPTGKQGSINYTTANSIDRGILRDFVESYGLSYIYQSQEPFITQHQKNTNDYTFSEYIKILNRINREKGLKIDDFKIKLTASKLAYKTLKQVENGASFNDIYNQYNRIIHWKDKENLKDSITKDRLFNEKIEAKNLIKVDSIQNIKGREEEKCLFIITNAIMKYLLNPEIDRPIKMGALLYVGLTRSFHTLTLYFTDETISKYGIDKIVYLMEEYDIEKIDMK